MAFFIYVRFEFCAWLGAVAVKLGSIVLPGPFRILKFVAITIRLARHWSCGLNLRQFGEVAAVADIAIGVQQLGKQVVLQVLP